MTRSTAATTVTLNRLTSALSGVGALKMSSLIFATIASILVARELGPQAYGQLALLLAVFSLLSIPSNNAIVPLLTRYVSQYDAQQRWPQLAALLAWARRYSTLAALAASLPLIGWMAFEWSAGDTSTLYTGLMGMAIIWLWGRAALNSGTLAGLRRVVMSQTFDWLVNPALYLVLLALTLSVLGLTVTSVLGCMLVALAVSVISGTVYARRTVPHKAQQVAPDHTNASTWRDAWRSFSLIQAVGVANQRAPVLLLGLFSTPAEAGLYRVADNVAGLLAVALLILNTVLGPYVARLHDAGQTQELERLSRSFARLAFAFTLPAAIAGWMAGPWLLQSLFSTAYAGAYAPLAILLVGQLINTACGSVGLILNMTGHERTASRSWVISLLVNLTLGAILVPQYGAIGAAIAATGSLLVWNFLLLLATRRTLGIRPAVL